jgi:uncharacterized protein YkwD
MNLDTLSIPFFGNWVDVLFLLILLYFIITNNGIITTTFEIIGLFLSIILSLKLYPLISSLLVQHTSISNGFAKAIGFIVIWSITEAVFFFVVKLLNNKIPSRLYHHKWNYYLGFIPGALYGIIFFTFIVTLLVALPVRGTLKKAVLDSKTGSVFVSYSSRFESSLQNVFNDAVAESLNFLTIKQDSGENIHLGFTLSENELSVDRKSENEMLNLINHERVSRGGKPLEADEQSSIVARQYGEEMFIHGFFSHESQVDSSTPAQRLDRNNIPYMIMGENLAYAPTLEIAHNGLMNSEGHRKNILSPEFHKVGIGVIDAGIYGKMFVQEFTN